MADETTPVTPTTPEPAPAQVLAESYDYEGEHSEAEAPAPDAKVTPAAKAAEKPKHSPRLVAMAEDMGIPAAEIAAMTTDSLETTVHHLQRQALSEARANQQARQQTAKALEVTQEDTGPDWGKDESGNPYTEKDYLPGIAATIKQNHVLQKELKELKGHVQAQAQRETQRQAQSQAEMYDAAFEALGADYERYFGKGAGADMEQQSPAMKRRIAVLVLAGAASATSLRSLKAKLKEAADTLYEPAPAEAAKPDPYAAVTGVAPKPAPKDEPKEVWKNGGVAKPTHRRGAAEPAGRDKAAKAVGKLMEEFGGVQDTTVKDEFPE